MNKIKQLPRLSGVQDASEQRSEAYMEYGERAVEEATRQSAKSDGGVPDSIREQAGVAREL